MQSEQAVEDHVEHKPHNEGIVKEKTMQETDSSDESGYSGPIDDYVRRLIPEAAKVHEQKRVERVIDNKCNTVVVKLLGKAYERAKEASMQRYLRLWNSPP